MLNYEKLSTVKGWLLHSETQHLYQLAKSVKPGLAIVEIGSWKGRSTVCLGQGSLEGAGNLVVAIDPHTGSMEHWKIYGKGNVDTFGEFKKNIQNFGLEKIVQPLVTTSVEAAKNFSSPVGLVFVDGNHSASAVKLDTNLWLPKIVPGSHIAFHDSWGWWGPNIVSAMLLLFSPKVRFPVLRGTITSFEVTSKASATERQANILFLLKRTLIGWVGAIQLGQESKGLQ